jgi:predicted transporter
MINGLFVVHLCVKTTLTYGEFMKVFGIILLLSGIFFTLYTFLYRSGIESPSVGLTPWIGIAVIITGAFFYYKARDEE